MPLTFKLLPIELLQPGRYQPRQTFASESLHELAASIQSHGLIEPLVVREVDTGQYEIIAGERRWRAAMLAQLSDLPCLIGEYTDEHAAAITLIENIQREDLNLVEEALGYQRLITEFQFHQDEIAALMGKSRSHIANLLRLLSLSEPIKAQLRQRNLSLGHARMLVGLSEHQQSQLLTQILTHDWSVRRLEQEVRANKRGMNLSHQTQVDRLRLETQLAEQIGAPVAIEAHSSQGGWLKIKYFDNDTLSGLLERLGLSYD